jgi:hypothetical protein
MTDWRTAMRDVVEQDAQDSLSTDAAQEMRRVVMAAAANHVTERSKSSWMRPVFVAATAVAIIAVGVAAGLRLDLSIESDHAGSGKTLPPVTGQPGSVSDGASAGEPNRQLQFLTPGGTRIIWVFNSDLDLKATLR